jgi:hypothetical protein
MRTGMRKQSRCSTSIEPAYLLLLWVDTYHIIGSIQQNSLMVRAEPRIRYDTILYHGDTFLYENIIF